MNLMTSYLLNDDVSYMILLFYILKDLDADIRRIIYDKLVTYEIVEETIYDWSELIISDYFDIDYLYDDLELYRDQ